MSILKPTYGLPIQAACIGWLILLSFSPILVNAQALEPRFQHYTTESGLIHANVFDVLQDQKGFIWIATERGLSRFDGHTFKNYYNDPADSTSMVDNFVYLLEEDNEGTIWIVGREALMSFDPEFERFKSYPIDPSDSEAIGAEINSLAIDRKGRVWAATMTAGISRLEPATGTLIHYRHIEEDPESLPSNSMSGIVEDTEGRIWIGMEEDGLSRLNPDTEEFDFFRYDSTNVTGIPQGFIDPVVVDRVGRVWFGTDTGLACYTPAEENFKKIILRGKTGRHLHVVKAIEGRDGTLWLATMYQGLVRFNPDTEDFEIYAHDESDERSIAHNQIRNLIEDRTGGLWVATNASLSKADLLRKPFENYEHILDNAHSLSNDAVFGIAQHLPGGDIWIGTLNGLNRFEPESGRFTRYNHDEKNPTSLSSDEIWFVHADTYGNVWSAPYMSGLDRWDPETDSFIHYRYDPADSTSLGGGFAFFLFEDSRQNMWVGTDSTLSLYNRETDSFTSFRPPGLEGLGIRAITEDASGVLWVGSEGAGLYSFDRETRTYAAFGKDVKGEKALPSSQIVALFADSSGEVWIGTDKGLHRMVRTPEGEPTGQAIHYYQKDGLSNNGVVGILEDDSGALWVSTANGLTKITRKAASSYTGDSASLELEFRTFDTHDGLPSNTFYIGPTLKTADGKIYLGTDRGFTTFDPSQIQLNPYPPEIAITDFQLFSESVAVGSQDDEGRVFLEKSISYSDKLELSYKDRVFSFRFSALHFGAPEKNRYAYKMEGFEEDWNFVQNRNLATYTNLSPGNYTFRVKAANLDNVWNEDGASLSITIHPPFWQTRWFRALSLLALGLAIAGVYRWRTSSIRRRNRILEEKIAIRTREINRKNEALAETNEELQVINSTLTKTNHRLEERSSELREALEQNKDILGVTAHDLKNPLAGMIGLLEMTLQDALEMDAESYREESATNLDMLKGQAERMLTNIKDLLDRYRSESHTALRLEEINLNDSVTNVLRWNQKRARDKNIAFHFDWLEDAVVQADSSAVHRILDNLISNAVKYNRIGGNVHIHMSCYGEGIRVSIQDEGQGLTEDDKMKVFGRMQRLSARPTAGEHSTGLGLHIVKQLVENHQGNVGVDSVYGEGAIFWFELPYSCVLVGRESLEA